MNGRQKPDAGRSLEPSPLAQPAPLLPVALGLMAGISVDRFLPWGPTTYVALGGAGLVAAAVGLLRRWRVLAIGATVVLIAAVGALTHHLHYRHVPPEAIVRLTGEQPRLCTLTGVISRRGHVSSSVPFRRAAERTWRWHLDVERARVGRFEGRVCGTVALSVRGRPDPLPALGERVEVVGVLFRMRPPDNPGQWDARDHARRNGIRARCFAETPEAVRRLADGPSWPGELMNLRAIRRGVGDLARAPLAQMPRYTASDEGRRLLAALLVGDRSEMDPDVKDAFVRTGTLHFLAISGLHVGLLAAFVWGVCRLCRVAIRPAAVVVIAVVVLYALAADFRPSIIRATIVVIALALGAVFGRVAGRLNGLSLAAVVMLSFRPADLFDTGFQLCFLVTASVVLVSPRLYERWFARHFEIERLRVYPADRQWVGFARGAALTWLAWLFCVSMAAWLAGAPLAAKSFGVIAPIAPLASLVLFPLVCLALVVGFAYLAVATWLPVAAAPLAVIAEGVAGLVNGTVGALARVPFGQIWTDGPSWPALGLLYALAVLWLVAPLPRIRRWLRGRVRPWHALAGILGVLIVETTLGLLPRRPDALSATVLAVGHGTAVVIECPNGQTLLYDAGSSRYSRVGASVIEPYLRRRGIGRIDVLFLSHPDLDHYSGAGRLLDHFAVGCIVTTPHFRRHAEGSPMAVALLEQIDASGIPLRTAAAGDRLAGAGEVEVRILGPPQRTLDLPRDRSAKNDASLVLSLEFAGRRMLLPGDIEEIGLEHLLARRPPPHDVLLSAHHGERGALAAALARRLEPAVVITSGGQPRALPTPPLWNPEIRHLQTSRHGAVRVRLTGRQIRCQSFRDGQWRPR